MHGSRGENRPAAVSARSARALAKARSMRTLTLEARPAIWAACMLSMDSNDSPSH